MVRQRYITTWRKRDQVLEWDHYVSEDVTELASVVRNLTSQGVKQYNTFPIGDRVADMSSEY